MVVSPTSCPKWPESAFDYAHRKLPGPDLPFALTDCASVESSEFERRIGELIAELATTHSVPKAELADYLRALPATVRQALRRPSDPNGQTSLRRSSPFTRAKSLAPYLPPRIPRFRPGDKPPGLDGWTLTELRGFGQCSETWRGEDPTQPEQLARLRSSSSPTPRLATASRRPPRSSPRSSS